MTVFQLFYLRISRLDIAPLSSLLYLPLTWFFKTTVFLIFVRIKIAIQVKHFQVILLIREKYLGVSVLWAVVGSLLVL